MRFKIYLSEWINEGLFSTGNCSWNYKSLADRTVSNKVLRVKASEIDNNLQNDGYQLSLTLVVHTFFD